MALYINFSGESTMNEGIFKNTLGKSLFLVLILALAAGTMPVLAAGDITGDWEITIDFNGRQRFATMFISKKVDGTYTGKWGSTELSDVKFDGQKLTFVRITNRKGSELKTTFEGTLKDGKIVGKLINDNGESTATSVRAKPIPAIVGQWDLSCTILDRDFTAKLSISQKPDDTLEGKWVYKYGKNVVSDVKFQDGKLTFSRTTKFPDCNEFTSTFEGTVKDHTLNGISKSKWGEMAISGQRVGAVLIGKWELTITSDKGPRTRMLTIYGDLSGRYEMFGGEVPIKDLKLEGDQVSFKVEGGFGDQTFTIEFKGKLEGETLTGQTSSERGTKEVTGKKVGPTS
jgi:hypothetical protein